MEGWACWQASLASIRGGMVAQHVDMGSALALAAAAGVAPDIAAELVMAAQAGMDAALAKKEAAK